MVENFLKFNPFQSFKMDRFNWFSFLPAEENFELPERHDVYYSRALELMVE